MQGIFLCFVFGMLYNEKGNEGRKSNLIGKKKNVLQITILKTT